MVLKILAAAYEYFPTDYTVHVATGLIGVLATYRIAQGRKTTRERDLHARVVVLTGAFTPLGLTLLEALAKRGAHVIALTPNSVADERVSTFIDLLRSTTSNENIYAEECDLASPPSIQAFAARFVKGTSPGPGPGAGPNLEPPRVDALVFAHEYAGVGAWGAFSGREAAPAVEQMQRDEGALGTFLFLTLLLPALLTAPVERDIRIVNVVNRFYAAAAPRIFKHGTYAFEGLFSSAPSTEPLSAKATTKSKSTEVQASPIPREATRALRTIILTRHLQRVLDALPSAPVPNPSENPADAPPPTYVQKSNVVAVSVSPGLSRSETVAPLFGLTSGSRWGWLFYVLLYPLLLLFAKSSSASIQSVLHVLFLPTPIKVKAKAKTPTDQEPEEALKPGALYAECSVVKLEIAAPLPSSTRPSEGASEGAKGKGKEKEKEELTEIPDDGELGGEAGGRAVWEAYEAGLKVWELVHPTPAPINPMGNAEPGAVKS
ncbi:hypothetical protein C8F04DRAFT_1094200 [Mycena alexandri]|uniref:Ketoreductase (KR) domain-containing protein n=1 Tax=Mycena alexandri TaxID=1745969 RepID=A0AAD6SZU1_9AGAR|nr:hypothetical protein C8F04DRAFT_1094200 [Mycena alexandri]